jgi:hypothetical protein
VPAPPPLELPPFDAPPLEDPPVSAPPAFAPPPFVPPFDVVVPPVPVGEAPPEVDPPVPVAPDVFMSPPAELNAPGEVLPSSELQCRHRAEKATDKVQSCERVIVDRRIVSPRCP